MNRDLLKNLVRGSWNCSPMMNHSNLSDTSGLRPTKLVVEQNLLFVILSTGDFQLMIEVMNYVQHKFKIKIAVIK